jgi:hypothetical protein
MQVEAWKLELILYDLQSLIESPEHLNNKFQLISISMSACSRFYL